jgi:hypothetical protein
MALVLNSVQCFAIGIVIFGFIGFLQGWRRSIVVMGFTLAAILFLLVGGANGVAEVLFVRIPQTVNLLTGGAIGPKSPPPPSANQVFISELVTLGVALLLGFVLAGRSFPVLKAGDPPIQFSAHTSQRFLGIIPGLVTGYAVMAYFGHILTANPTVSVGVATPSPSSLGSYIVLLVVIALLAIILWALTGRFGK